MNSFLVAAAGLSALAAFLHVGCIIFGASWYRFFGAGERMAQLAAAGSRFPTLVTTGIAAVLAVWSLYALSAAGIGPRLPFARLVLCGVAGVYLVRGLVGFFLVANPLGRSVAFWLWSSAICLVIAAVHVVGLWQSWFRL